MLIRKLSLTLTGALVLTVAAPTRANAQTRVEYVDPGGNLLPLFFPPRKPQWASLHATVGISASVMAVVDSSFNQTAQIWGYHGFNVASTLAVDGGVHITRFIIAGARVGYLSADGGRARTDNALIRLDAPDVSAIVRVGLPIEGDALILYPAIQLEAGVIDAVMSLRDQTNSALLARFAGQLMLSITTKTLGLNLRAGYQFAEWNQVNSSGTSLSLAGISVGLGLEVHL